MLSSSAASLFSPSQWLDATDPLNNGTPPANGASVPVWKDKSGYSNDLGQYLTYPVPTYATNNINGLSAVNFANSSGLISGSFNKSRDVTVITVTYIPPTMAASYNVFWGHFNQGTNGLTSHDNDIALRTTPAGLMTFHTNNDNTNGLSYKTGSTSMFSCTMSGGTNLFMQQTNTNGTTTKSWTNPLTWTSGIAPVWVGIKADLTYCQSQIGEILYYQRVLTTEQRQVAEGYLAWKWGIQANLPTTHPYFSFPPCLIDPVPYTYLALAGNAANTGSSTQTVTVGGSVTYKYIDNRLCAYFNNSNTNYISIPFTTSPQFTISYWFNAKDAGYYQPWGLGNNAGTFGINTDLNYTGGGDQGLYVSFSGGTVNAGNFTYPTASGVWFYVTLSIDTVTGICKSYLNGVLKTTVTGSGTFNRQYLLLARAGNGAGTFNGYLRNFAVFNAVLTDTQISVIYKASLPIHNIPPPLILLRGVNYTGGSSWTDYSGFGKTATLEGGTAAINTANNAIVLNGSTSWTFPDVGVANAYTASVWIKPTNMSSSTWAADNCILTQTFNAVTGERKVPLSLCVQGTSTTSSAGIVARFWNPSLYQNTVTNISNNNWTHVVITWNGTNMTTYLNGTQSVTSVLASSITNGGTVWRIGRRWDSANYITGEVAEVSMYATPMTSEQVTAVYQRGLNDVIATAPPAITSIAVTFITQTSFIVNWAGGYGATSCIYTLDGSPVTPSVSNPYLQTATFTGLTNSTTYLLGITATNATGTVSSSASITTASPRPTAPVITASSVTGTSFVLTWTGGVTATSYQYKLNTISLTPSIDNGVASKTATFTGLSPSTIYTVEVSAVNYEGSTASSLSVTTTIAAPVAAVVTISSITPSSFVASWTGGTNATSYTYTLDGLTVTPSIDNGMTTKTATFSNLLAAKTYSFVVNPTNAGGPTPTTKSVTTLIAYPTVPAITITALADTSFTVSYSSTGASSYSYLLKKGTVTVVTTPSISGSTATYSGLTSLTEYTLVITGTNTTGSTNSAATPITTLIAPPTTPVVTIGSVRDTRFVASWTGGLRATSYTYTLNGDPATPSIDNGLGGSATFTGLKPSTPYTLIVTAVNSTNPTSSIGTTVTTLIPPPTAPVVSAVTRDTTATISWSGGSTATSYAYALASNGLTLTPTIVDNGVAGRTATITGLTASTDYNIIITATNGTGSTASASTSFTTLIAPPTKPIVTIGSIRDTSFVATWTGGVRATSYTYTLNGNAATPSIDGTSSATFTGLIASTTYALIVTATNSTDSTASSSTSMTTLIPPPTTPAGLAMSDITDTSFIVSWTGGDPASSYTYTLDGTPTTPATDDIVNDTASFTGLKANTTYVLIVTAVDSTGPTSSAPISVTTLPPRPTAAVVSSNLVKDSSFFISWTGAEGATSYRYTLNGTLTIPSVDSGTINRTATFTGLTASTSYDVVVISKNGTGPTNSQVINVQTMPPPPTTPVLTISSLRDTSFTVTWTGAIGVYSYIYALNSQFVTPSIDAGLTGRSATFTGLSPSNTYSLVVAAVNPTGTTYSLASSFTTLPPAPTAPVVTISKVTALSFAARWTGSGATSYTYTINDELVTPTIVNGLATFTGLLPNTPYSLVVIATNVTGSTNSAAVSTRTLTSPTKPTGLTASVTSGSFMVSWTGGADVTSYAYLLNSIPFTPTDNGLVNQTATFLGLSELSEYTCTVIARNSYGVAASDILSIRTSKRPPPTTQLTALKLQQNFTNVPIVDPVVAATAIQDALVSNAPATVAVAAMSLGTPVMFTALVNNPNFMGTTVTIPAHAAGLLYNSFANRITLDVSLPLNVNFPDASGVAAPSANSNSKLAIDLTVDRFVPLKGCTGYGIHVVGGVQYFVTPTSAGTLINLGDVITFTTDSGATISFTVADLDIVFIPYKEPVSFICFLGSAPVLTPTGYRRIDRLAVGDIVKTPKGTAVIEAIKTQLCEPSAESNPYVIPEGVFGANRKLLISPRHKVSVSGHMFEARKLGLQQEEQAKPFTYYNLQITGTQNMIVAGVEVESLKPLVRVTVSRGEFERMLPKYGGLTREVKAKCYFLPDGSVSVPSVPSVL